MLLTCGTTIAPEKIGACRANSAKLPRTTRAMVLRDQLSKLIGAYLANCGRYGHLFAMIVVGAAAAATLHGCGGSKVFHGTIQADGRF